MAIGTSAFIPGNDALQQLNKALPQIISVILVIALGYTLAQFSWQFYLQQQEQMPITPVTTTLGATKLAARPQQNIRQITSSHLLGMTTTQAGNVPAQDKAPVTKLNLVLRGVLAAQPASLGAAIIAAGKGKEEVYGIGDTIQRGVKLSEILSDHVIIDRQGKLEKLVLVKSRGLSATGKRSNSRQSSRFSTGSLGDIRKEIMKNPTSFGEYALPVVVKQNGKQVGYRLKPQKKGALLAEYGIKPGDIITEINGVKLDKPQNGIKALRQLSSASEVSLVVKRGQSFVPLNIQLQ
jgi:general secretion pathway protein C